MRVNWPIRKPLMWSIALGASFGLLLRVSAAFDWFRQRSVMGLALSAVMSLSYLALGSAAVGYVTVWCAENKAGRPIWQWILLAWCSTLVVMVGAAIFLLEGVICLVFALPLVMPFASIGGVLAGVIRRKTSRRLSVHLCVIFLPLILPQAEVFFPAPLQIRIVRSEIRIFAPPSEVWKNIASVSAIHSEELPITWTEKLGFPRPIAATLSYEGVGGIRNATFERGVRFVETVTNWEPSERLSFTIKADTARIPPTTLDRHVTIGGPYFDVLDGEYQIERVGKDIVILHLISHERLNTDFNGYAGLWTDAVMSSIQRSILQVIKNRCEAPDSRLQTPLAGK